MTDHDDQAPTLSRRLLLKNSALTLGGISLATGSSPFASLARAQGADPHYFLQIVIPFGMDATYLFDARPLAMTAAGKIANYLEEEPEAWVGGNGQTTLATRLTEPLKPFRDQFSVLNGVVMAATFDGHDQNMNYLFTGNPFGGESYIPHLNQHAAGSSGPLTPLDYVQTGFIFADLTNTGASMPLYPYAAYALVNRLRRSTPVAAESPLFRFMRERMAANGAGPGRFSKASAAMDRAAAEVPALAGKLRDLQIAQPTQGNDLGDSIAIVAQFFRADVTRCAMITIQPEGGPDQNLSLDTHGAEQAKDSGAAIGSVAAQIAKVMQSLKDTPFDATRSMFDVTTIAVASEFSRTMRQRGMAIDATGTDHNPLTNTILLGGKGVKGGLVVGASDAQTATETLSAAHLSLDREELKVMGRPFDFDTLRPVDARPEVYRAADYLSAPSVANTIYSLFGIDQRHWWNADRNGPVAEPLRGLLT